MLRRPASSSSAFPLPSAVSPSVFPPPSAVFPSTCALFASSSTARDHRPHRNPHWGPSDPSSPLHREFVQVPRKEGALHLSRETNRWKTTGKTQKRPIQLSYHFRTKRFVYSLLHLSLNGKLHLN